jgi:hypothetical protein
VSEGDFLSRWSRRKLAAKAGREVPEPAAIPAPAPLSSPPAESAGTAEEIATAPTPLPPVESLTPESDFAPFMQPNVDGGLRRTALKTLFQDPRFNVMDGLDVYIDDYSKPDPLPEGWLEKMNQVAHLGHYQPPPEPGEPAALEAEAAAAAVPSSVSAPQAPGETTEGSPAPQDSATDASEPHSRS